MSSAASVVSYDSDPAEKPKSPLQLPEPTGYRMLVTPKQVSEKTEGGILLPEERRDKESEASMIMCVMKMGEDCYMDKKKFPNGPWCKVGDWVIVPSYAGTRVLINGMHFRIINDDTVQAVVEDPRGVGRA